MFLFDFFSFVPVPVFFLRWLCRAVPQEAAPVRSVFERENSLRLSVFYIYYFLFIVTIYIIFEWF